MPVLAIDTATRAQSAAVAAHGRVLAESAVDTSSSHSTSLLRSVQEVLRGAGVDLEGLTAIAVTAGPGSFTGIRIGMATAKGLALSTGIRLAGFSTLHVLAEALCAALPSGEMIMICALLDAGRGQVYRGAYRWERVAGRGHDVQPVGEETAMAPAAAVGIVEPGWILGGEGAAHYRGTIMPLLPPGASLVDRVPRLAPALALMADSRERQGVLDQHPLVPNYVRPPDAVRGGGA